MALTYSSSGGSGTRSAAASAWLYHVGLDAFAAGEHLRHGRRVAAAFALLLTRDLGIFATVLRKGGGTEAMTRLSIALAAVTDIAAAAALRGDLPLADFETDRAISQFGLRAS